MIDISIIIPCYNSEKYISETIDSIKNQKFNNWECIIVNDGSTDNSEKIILSMIYNDNRFRYVKQENKGPSNARNNGVKLSKAKYITFIDADDILGFEYISNGVNYMNNHEELSLYYGKVIHFDENKEFIYKPSTKEYKQILRHNQFHTTTIIRRCDFINCGGYNEDLDNKEDWEFYVRFLYKDKKFYISDDIAFKYRYHDNSRDNKSMSVYRQYFNEIRSLNKHIYKEYDIK